MLYLAFDITGLRTWSFDYRVGFWRREAIRNAKHKRWDLYKLCHKMLQGLLQHESYDIDYFDIPF